MPRESLTPHEAQAMLLYVARRLEESKDQLTKADRAIGDGDHGVGMARGFEAVRQQLESCDVDTAGKLLRAVGQALLSSAGGASGVLFATFFTEGARRLEQRETFDAEGLRCLLGDGLDAVQRRGGAMPGDKTMVDALAPAAQKARELPTDSLVALLPAVSEAARRGVEQTKGMVARTGKAKALGARSLGHPDPGALSIYLILRSMTEYASD